MAPLATLWFAPCLVLHLHGCGVSEAAATEGCRQSSIWHHLATRGRYGAFLAGIMNPYRFSPLRSIESRCAEAKCQNSPENNHMGNMFSAHVAEDNANIRDSQTREGFMRWFQHASANALVSTSIASIVATMNPVSSYSASWNIQDVKKAIEADFVTG